MHDKREHPETWTYEEILDKCDKKPDLILQMDPHFYFVGEKPKDITCAYYVVDVHRGADVFRRMALAGNFDYIFMSHKYFMPIYERVGLNCFWLPRAYDDNYIKEFPEIEIECDIVFIGGTGLHKSINDFPIIDTKIMSCYHEGPYPDKPPWEKYKNWENHTMEYAERAEVLHRLSKDFNLRVYEDTSISRGPIYGKVTNRGKIIVNHSLWYDSALRNFEVLACNRFLITDMLPYQDELLQDGVHYRSYRQYFLPFLDNFKLEYEEIKELVEWYLKNDKARKYIAEKGRDFVMKYHTFKNRANTIIDTINGRANGYTKQF